MKTLKIILYLFSFFPLIWILIFFSTILIFFLNFDHLPIYGIDPDLSALNQYNLIKLSGYIFRLTFYLFPFWIIVNGYILFFRKKEIKGFLFPILTYIIYIVIFFTIRTLMVNQFSWFLD